MADKSRSNAERIALLRRACDVHQSLYRDAMNGRGIDRHIFGLFVLSKGLGYVRTADYIRDENFTA
jgi:Choline/Carnitine o-acyltransferase